jgi:DNA-directed RNA polymerase specialized sigma24 family protein
VLRKQPYEQKAGIVDERIIVQEMLYDPKSEHWTGCKEFVTQQVGIKLSGMMWANQEEIIDDVLFKIVQYLPEFRFECTLRVYIGMIIKTSIINFLRKRGTLNKYLLPPVGLFTDKDEEGKEIYIGESEAADKIYELRESVRSAISVFFEYAETHSNHERNRKILTLFLWRNLTHAQIAKQVGCDSSVVGYIIREAQRYARDKMKD